MTRPLLVLCLASVVLAGCVSRPPPDVDWAFNGKLAATVAGKGARYGVSWRQEGSAFDIRFRTMFGLPAARISGDDREAWLDVIGKPRRAAPDADALADLVLGYPLPVRQLAWWVTGEAMDGGDPVREAQALGWQLQLQVDPDDPAARPRRVDLERPGMRLRLVVSEWQGDPG